MNARVVSGCFIPTAEAGLLGCHPVFSFASAFATANASAFSTANAAAFATAFSTSNATTHAIAFAGANAPDDITGFTATHLSKPTFRPTPAVMANCQIGQ